MTLSGHTHGGQVRLPLIGALWLDIPRADKPYDQGMFDEGGCKLFVTRGVGMSKLLFARSAILRFTCSLLQIKLNDKGYPP